MANVGNITANINVNTAQLERGLKQSGRKMRTFTQSITTGFNRVKSAILSTKGAILGLGAGFAIGTAIRKTTSEFIKFEDALLDLQKVMSDTEGKAKSFIGVTENLSKTFGESAAEVLQGAANFKQAGFTVQEAFELQEVALRAATVSNLDVIESSKIVIRILKGFKAPASEAARVLDIMNEVSNRFATNLGELATGMAQLSPVAKLMGFTFEETAAILTPIIEVFGSGSEAAVALRTSLLRLVSDQVKVQQTLRDMGVAQKDVNGRLRSGKDILFDVAKAFKTLDQNQKVFTAGQLVGIRQAARAVEVFDNLAKVQKVHEVAIESANSALREQEIRLASVGKKLDRLREAFNNTAREIGATVAPALVEVITFFGKLAKLAIAPFRFDMTELAGDVKEFLGIARSVSVEVSAIRVGGQQIIPSAQLREIVPPRGSIKDFIERNKEAKLSMADLFQAQDNLAIQVDDTMKRFNLQAQGINVANKSLAETIILLRQLRSTSLLPQEPVRISGFLDFEKQPFIEERLISETQLFNIEESAKRVSKAFADMGLKTDTELRRVAKSLIANFKTIETETTRQEISVKRLGEIWKLTAKQIEPSVLGEKTAKVFDDLNVKFNNVSKEIKETGITTMETLASATAGWASSFARDMTDVLFGAEVTFGSILESFTRMLVQMAIQLSIINPLLQSVFGASIAGGTGIGIIGKLFGKTQTAAEGGLFMKPALTTIAEREPELAIPLSRLGDFAGGGNVEVNVFGAPEGTQVEEGESGNGGRKIDVILDEKIADQIRPGTKTFNKLTTQFSNMSPATIRR